MKKYLFFVAAIAMVGCSKNDVPSFDNENANGIDQKYVIYAEDINTKTVTNSSFNVSWADGDNLAVYTWPVGTDLPSDATVWQAANPVNFVAVAGDATPRPFSLSNTDDPNKLATTSYEGRLNAFKTRFGDGKADLQWGVIYPGKQSNASKPGMGIVVFGDKSKVRAIQEGNDNMDHLAYQDVLWGTATGANPTIRMKHLGTMMEYTVKNATSSEFIVKSIKISVPAANIGGEFRFNVFEGTFDSCMTPLTECSLWVSNGTAIAAGGSANFYQVLAPFELAAGKTITMTVETDKGDWTKTMTLASDMSFEGGKKNPTTLSVTRVLSSDATLVTHEDTDEIWFSKDSNLGKYLNMANGDKYSYGGTFNPADVDIVIFRGSGKTALTFAAPTDSGLQDYIDNSIKGWTTINATKVKKVEIDFDSVTLMSELKTAYDAASGEGERCVLAMNETAIVKTVDGEYALIKVIGGTKYDAAWGSYMLSVKTVK